MITAQDIQEKAFDRAGKGYNMEQVDEFLDEMAEDFAAMSKENAALKSKMKMLVQKVDEYRQTEDSMRLASSSIWADSFWPRLPWRRPRTTPTA